MQFNHLHFFVDNVAAWHDRFVRRWGATPLDSGSQPAATSRLVSLGQVPLLFSAPEPQGGPVARYLQQHPPGIGDMAFQVDQLEPIVTTLVARGGQLLEPIQTDPQGAGRWCRVQGWGSLSHTLVQPHRPGSWIPGFGDLSPYLAAQAAFPIDGIDHVVLNVAAGQLPHAADWYIQQLGFCPRQQFTIDTPRSGLRSQVLAHPQGNAQIPINEPATPNSQVQEFLAWNRGSGVQHVALHTRDILSAVKTLKGKGIEFLNVPSSYYQALTHRPGYQVPEATLEAIAQLEILIDWEPQRPQACLLQTFTQPLLDIPTLFFELIQRKTFSQRGEALQALGFGERNFQALFEAIEREQSKRGSLQSSPSKA